MIPRFCLFAGKGGVSTLCRELILLRGFCVCCRSGVRLWMRIRLWGNGGATSISMRYDLLGSGQMVTFEVRRDLWEMSGLLVGLVGLVGLQSKLLQIKMIVMHG